MIDIFLTPMSQEDLEYDGFFDGQNKIIPDNTELNILVTGGFNGIEEGKAEMACYVNVIVTSQGQFYGQKYKHKIKVHDNDVAKRDQAKINLSVLDAQAGFPLSQGRMPITTENMEEHWVGKAHARAKFGYGSKLEMEKQPDGNGGFMDVEVLKEFNWIRGFGYLREKMLPPVGSGQSEQIDMPGDQQTREVHRVIKESQQQYQGTPVDSSDDIGF
jgi:hypothetical protein